MAETIDLFIAGPKSLEELRDTLGQTFGVRFERLDDPVAYATVIDDVPLELTEHDYYEDDHGMAFSRYPFVVQAKLRGPGPEPLFRRLFSTLKGRFSLLLSRDLQEQLDISEVSRTGLQL
jgi:hypothetical protein